MLCGSHRDRIPETAQVALARLLVEGLGVDPRTRNAIGLRACQQLLRNRNNAGTAALWQYLRLKKAARPRPSVDESVCALPCAGSCD